MKVAKVKTVSSSDKKVVAITSADKPTISEELQKKWQKILDLAAKIIGVPAGLITRLNENDLEVFLTSKTEGNIFEANTKLELGLGWYCENVAATREQLTLPNALKSESWSKDNPSIPFNMISYMGMPILWPDGEVFGTFCMLDNKENQYSQLYKDLMLELREIIQSDLKSMLLFRQAQDDIVHKEAQLREVHHSVKNHFNLLISSVNLQSMIGSGNNSIESVLTDIHSRISALSLIHDKLYRSMNLENLLLGDYLKELGKQIVDTFAKRPIIYNCICDDITTDSRISIPCGLLLNELVTNSLKYAFDNTYSPTITLKVEINDSGETTFIYRDNGSGLPKDFDIENSNTLGMLLIKQLVVQLQGTYRIINNDGFVFQTIFKI